MSCYTIQAATSVQEQRGNKSKEEKQEQMETRTSGAHKTGKDMKTGHLDRKGAARDMCSLRCNFQAVEA